MLSGKGDLFLVHICPELSLGEIELLLADTKLFGYEGISFCFVIIYLYVNLGCSSLCTETALGQT